MTLKPGNLSGANMNSDFWIGSWTTGTCMLVAALALSIIIGASRGCGYDNGRAAAIEDMQREAVANKRGIYKELPNSDKIIFLWNDEVTVQAEIEELK